MTATDPVTDERVSLYAVGAILDRLGPMLKEAPGVIACRDAECLHRMRVASRRLRTALRFLGGYAALPNAKALLKLARSVTRTLGEARDVDVRISWLDEFEGSCSAGERRGVRRAALRLRQRREALQPKVARKAANTAESPLWIAAGKHLRGERLREEMAAGADPLFNLEYAARVICLQLDAVTDCAVSLESPEASSAQHQMRIETKRLRYAMEIFGGLFDDPPEEYIALAKKLQTMLGDLHDADVWISAMPVFTLQEKERALRYYGSERPFAPLRAGILAISRDRAAFRAEQYGKTKRFWDETQDEGKWRELRECVIGGYRKRTIL